ncbi:MAG: histidine phosphatase family protein [Xanthomonadales bacterium]|nr:histidine phosphatase family protein [Xanthomonadales bacterium]
MIRKTIFVVRHGHAVSHAETDFARALTEKGIHAVKQTADFIKNFSENLSQKIQACICSAAERTSQTAKIVCSHCRINCVETKKELYSTYSGEWLKQVEESPFETLLLVGHNPTLSELVTRLSGQRTYMSPSDCAIVSLEFKEDGIIYPAELVAFHNNE